MSDPVPIGLVRLAHGVGLPLPRQQTPGAAGLDLAAALLPDDVVEIAPGAFAMIPTGLTIALPEGYEAQIRPRSGLSARHGITVLNAPGTVDASVVYRMLREMEVGGWVTSQWDTAGSGPPRRVYQVTPEGEAYLAAWVDDLRYTREELDRFIAFYVRQGTASESKQT